YDQAGALHALLLGDTGDAQDPESQDIASRAGPPADFVCDGTWHSTLVPLQRCFSGSLPQAGFAALRGFSLHDHGWRGSRRAMQYWVHRVQPVPAGRTADFKFFWQATDITGISDYAACLDQDPQTDPQGKQELASGQTLDAALAKRGAGLKDGWNYLHVRVKNGAGVWSAPTHTRFMLDNTPPQVLRTEPRVDSVYAGQTVSIFFNEEHGIDLTALRLSINGQLVPGWQSLRFDPARNCITCNALAAGVRWPERGKVSVELQGLKDLLGNQAAAPFTFSFTADKGAAWLGPAITQMRFTAPAYMEPDNRQMDMETSFSLDFEEHTGHVRALRDCRMEWLDDPALACFGRRAVRFTALDDDADVQIMLHKNPWYLDRGPLLQFDYKAEAGLCVDILVEVLDKWSSIRFTGAGAAPEGGKAIGRVEAVVADGTWRHASVDLKSLIDTAWPNLEVRIVNKVILSAQGRPGCKRGSSLVLDNLELSRPMMTGGRFEWQAEASPSGLAGYSFVFDQNAATVPPERFAETGNTAAAGSRTGVWYAHVRACDQAGNWGPARTMRVDFGE
ncbi:MAG: Ig-like domain-containing protein, partial [Planctomycetota bacterium]